MSEPMLVLTTVPNSETAATLATDLVEQNLAACVNIAAPSTSVYRWQGRTEQAHEILLTIKTTRAAYSALEHAIVERHPYDVPEVIGLPITAGLNDYLHWIDECTQS